MINRENVMREALSDLEAQRARNMDEEQRRKDEACGKSAAIAELLQKRQQLFFGGMRRAFAAPAQAKEISDSMRKEMEEINAGLRKALRGCGLPEDYLQPVYRCPICKDTGYVGEPVHEPCVCLKRAVLNKLYENEGLQGLENENFEMFNENLFPDTPFENMKGNQRAFIRRCRKFCEDYADEFEAGTGKGILMYGRSGLGKTFMMNCVAQRVLERGFSVVVISAYKLIETMRKYQFSGENADQVQDMLTCDLLAIDDLGSEPMYRGVTISALYHIISERHNSKRAILVTTNCDADQLSELYEDRITNRLKDPSRMMTIHFMGTDVRRFTRPNES